jgi:hypothetical protein
MERTVTRPDGEPDSPDTEDADGTDDHPAEETIEFTPDQSRHVARAIAVSALIVLLYGCANFTAGIATTIVDPYARGAWSALVLLAAAVLGLINLWVVLRIARAIVRRGGTAVAADIGLYYVQQRRELHRLRGQLLAEQAARRADQHNFQTWRADAAKRDSWVAEWDRQGNVTYLGPVQKPAESPQERFGGTAPPGEAGSAASDAHSGRAGHPEGDPTPTFDPDSPPDPPSHHRTDDGPNAWTEGWTAGARAALHHQQGREVAALRDRADANAQAMAQLNQDIERAITDPDTRVKRGRPTRHDRLEDWQRGQL